MKKGDKAVLLALAGLLLLSALPRLFAVKEEPRWAVVYVDGIERKRLSLDGPLHREEILAGEGHRCVVTLGEGRIRFSESDCPDRLCVAQGWLDRPGQAALCLPNRIEIRLEGSGKGGNTIDALSF